MSYAILKNGLGWWAVDSQDDIEPLTQIWSEEPPATLPILQVQQNNGEIKEQLSNLDEKLIRSLHEAILALVANGATLPADTITRLNDIQTQKQYLRGKLQ